MRKPLLVALFLGTAALAPAADSAPTANRIALLNGRDLAGWTMFLKEPVADQAALWSFADGVLRFAGKPYGYIRTEKSFSKYRLHVEWRWPADANPKSNSGVFVHVHGPDAIWPGGVECQLAAGNAGQFIGTDVQMPGVPVTNNKPRAPKLAASSENPFGEWNTYDITCRGDSIEVLVNGVKQNRVEKISLTAGAIALQMEGYPIEFRHVWLEPL
jgi:hypothetical protein